MTPKLWIALWVATAPAWGAGEAQEFFETKVRPVLANNCYACHTASKLGGLQVNSRDALLKGGNSGPAVVPGKPEQSLLIRAVSHTDPRLKMPMGSKLQDHEIADLTEWIKMGAPWPEQTVKQAIVSDKALTPEQRAFWAFRPIQKVTPPEVRNKPWVQTAIDNFILAQLENKGLEPVDPASKRALIRRATYDLLGLPPTPKEIETFLKDSSPDAFARLVDRLLGSPHYGERWGRYWLDVARYAEDDVRGASRETYPNAFRYRDWIIAAFNEDMPYSLFVKAQIAGDLIDEGAGATSYPQFRLTPATGFFGIGPWYYDTAQPPMARANERNERVDVITRGFLGLTVSCARCHDHKYDPISTKDYYALAGVFGGVEYAEYPLAPQKVVLNLEQYDRKSNEQKAAIQEYTRREAMSLAEVLAAQTSKYLVAAWKVMVAPKLQAAQCAQQEGLDTETLERWVQYLGRKSQNHPYLTPWIELIAKRGADDELRRFAAEFQKLVLAVLSEKQEIDAENQPLLTAAERARKKRHQGVLLPNRFVTYDDYVPNGELNLKALERDRSILWRDLFGPAAEGKETGVLYYTAEKLERFLSGEWKRHLDSLKAEIESLKKSGPPKYEYLHGVREAPKPANLRLHVRGDPNNLGEEVPRRFISVLSTGEPEPFHLGSGRLELAEAIAAHPLTARVIVNRVWQYHFGRGIVNSPSNFGQLGDRPTHPELLEYLAGRLVANNGSLKTLHREIMLSSAYQLSSRYSKTNFDADPENRLYWRANIRRLDAEAIRDSLLFVGGNLDMKIGGPSAPSTDEHQRRTLYTKVSRFKLDQMLAAFDFPEASQTSERRDRTNVPLQRLYFLNGSLVWRQAEALAKRLEAEADLDDAERIRRAYLLLYGRPAVEREVSLALDFLRQVRKETPSPNSAWTQLGQVLLTANEFIFID